MNKPQLLPTQKINYSNLKGRGGKFLVSPVDEGNCYSRDMFSEENKMFLDAVKEFAEKQILPINSDLNVLNEKLNRDLFLEMGELGILNADFPEAYGGMSMDKVTSIIIAEGLMVGLNASFMVTFADHTGIGSLPIVWYGSKAQKEKYLPKLASGEWMASFALTEPGAGSDALAGSTQAVLNEAGTHYILNGTKIFVTNGSWADTCVTFAWVDGKKFTSFILDKDCEGWVVGAEEKKIGIKGSSTVTYFFENCQVPVENVLGRVGNGSAVAFNVLYVGRYKLGGITMGGAKGALELAYEYAEDRKQFDVPIRSFGMIQKKMVNLVVRAWEADAVTYMTAGSIDDGLTHMDPNDEKYYEIVQKGIEDHGIETSICKIVGSDASSANVDDALQIFGGNGFIEEFPIAVMYKDDRINRIFEGTNEINRLIIGGTILKKAVLEELPIREMISNRSRNWIPDRQYNEDERLNYLAQLIEFSRSLFFFTLNESINYYGQDLKNEQWILEPIADMLISLAIMDSGFKRNKNIKENSSLKSAMMPVIDLVIHNRLENMLNDGGNILAHLDCCDNHERKNELTVQKQKLQIKFSRISTMKLIMKDIDKNKKYYLD